MLDATGMMGYYAGPDVYIVDRIGLSDALLARLPISNIQDWRIGHFRRELPAGYKESLLTGTNQIVDPGIRALYGTISLIIRGPLLDRQRLVEIVTMNLGATGRFVPKTFLVSHSSHSVAIYGLNG